MQRRGFLTALAALVVGPRLPVAPVPAAPSLLELQAGYEAARRAMQAVIGVPPFAVLALDELSQYADHVIADARGRPEI